MVDTIFPLGELSVDLIQDWPKLTSKEHRRLMDRLAYRHSCRQAAPSSVATPCAHHLCTSLDRFRILLVSLSSPYE
jgi:hypothetical protein